MLAPSRRGGDFSQHRRKHQEAKKQRREATLSVSSRDHVSPHLAKPNDDSVRDSLQNPSDALLILAHAAGQPDDITGPKIHTDSSDHTDQGEEVADVAESGVPVLVPQDLVNGGRGRMSRMQRQRAKEDVTINSYSLIKDGTIDPILLVKMLRQ